MAQISERQGRMPNDAPNANGSNDSSEESSESLTSSETFEAFNSLDSIHISASAPDGEANEVRIFSKKHAKELCPNDAAANEDPEREERYKRAQMTRPGFSVQGMQDNQVMVALRSSDPALWEIIKVALKNALAEI